MSEVPIYSLKKFPASSNDFYANDFSTHLRKHHFIHHSHKHDFYLCVFFTKGTGEHTIDFKSYDVKPGCIFFLTPGQFHHWKFDEKPEGFIFFHSSEFYDLNYQNRQIHDFPFFFSEYNSPVLELPKNSVGSLIPLFESLLEEFNNQFAFRNLRLVSLVDLIYIQVSRIYLKDNKKEVAQSKGMFQLRSFEKLVDIHFRELKSPSQYADLMHISNKHLNRIVKLAINKTASELIANRIIIEAKRMLTHSDNRVSEVAEHLGFCDYSYFNRFFKKHTRQTPLSFAKGEKLD